jgi:hypothetical protein
VYVEGMYFYQEPLVAYALELFRTTDFTGAARGDWFFSLFAPGNTIFFAERPFERFSDYEELLWRLREADAVKYRQIHKGIPFYFMSWLAFDRAIMKRPCFTLMLASQKTSGKTQRDGRKIRGHDSCSSIKGIRPLRVQFSP